MKIDEAASILGLSGDITPELVKQAYRLAAKKYHPDRNPAGLEMMQAVNRAYEVLKDYIGKVNAGQSDWGEELNATLNKLLDLPGIRIEIIGNWIWVSGNTYPLRKQLLDYGLFWASKKCMWYFRPPEHKSSSRGSRDIDAIRTRYGTSEVTKRNRRTAISH